MLNDFSPSSCDHQRAGDPASFRGDVRRATLPPVADTVCRLSQQLAARAFQVEVGDLRRPSRCRANIALARQAAMYLANVAGEVTFTDVARRFGRDRSTVSHACGLIEDLRDDAGMDAAIDLLSDALRASCRMNDLRQRVGRRFTSIR